MRRINILLTCSECLFIGLKNTLQIKKNSILDLGRSWVGWAGEVYLECDLHIGPDKIVTQRKMKHPGVVFQRYLQMQNDDSRVLSLVVEKCALGNELLISAVLRVVSWRRPL